MDEPTFLEYLVDNFNDEVREIVAEICNDEFDFLEDCILAYGDYVEDVLNLEDDEFISFLEENENFFFERLQNEFWDQFLDWSEKFCLDNDLEQNFAQENRIGEIISNSDVENSIRTGNCGNIVPGFSTTTI